MREKRHPGEPFQRVRVLEHIRRNKWRVQWVEPNPGLVDYVESRQLVVPWKELRAFLKEEEDENRIREHNKRHGYDHEDSPVVVALQQVFESVGESLDFHKGSLVGMPEAIERVVARAGVTSRSTSFVSYVDRRGQVHQPFDVALDLARKFCAAEPATVLVGVEATEREWTSKANRGEDYIIGLLNSYRASWALIREWAGLDSAIAMREAEIQRLERLVWDAVYALQKAGCDREANKLRRAVSRD